jgi:Ca2+-binding RTX toxin-like protein
MTQAVFIDSRVATDSALLDSLSLEADDHVFILDAQEDGLLQMARDLAGTTGLGAIHVISHGAIGALQLGNGLIDAASLNAHAADLAAIGQSLASTGDLLLYGCNVAQGDTGLAFIGQLATLTGADVAASVDATGNLTQSANWILEASTGQVDASNLAMPDLSSTLLTAVPTYQTHLGFSLLNQPLWAVPDWAYTMSLWDMSLPTLQSQDIVGGGTVAVSQFDAGTSASIDMGIHGGSWGTEYPVDAQLRLPGNIRPGDTFLVDTTRLSVGSPTLHLSGPSIGLTGTAEIHANADLAFQNIFGTGVDFNPSIHSALNYTIFNFTPFGKQKFTVGPMQGELNLDLTQFKSDPILVHTGTDLIDINAVASINTPIVKLILDVDDIIPGFQNADQEIKLGWFADAEVGVLSIDAVISATPYLKATLDVQTVDVQLSTNYGDIQNGVLGDAFTFQLPSTYSQSTLDVSAAYRLSGTVNIEAGIKLEGGLDIKLGEFSVEGNIPWISSSIDFALLELQPTLSHDFSMWNRSDPFTIDGGVFHYSTNVSTASPTEAIIPGAKPSDPATLTLSILNGTEQIVNGSWGIGIDEGNSGEHPLTFRITRTGDLTQAANFTLTFEAGPELDAQDFSNGLPTTQNLQFASGVSQLDYSLPLIGDAFPELDEKLIVRLQSNGATIKTPETNVFILSDDGKKFYVNGFNLGTTENDYIVGSTGNDTILSSTGNDTIFGGGGVDSINGGPGIDRIEASYGFFDGGTGNDTLNIPTINTSTFYGYTNWKVTNATNAVNFNLNYGTTKTNITDALASGTTFTLQYFLIDPVPVLWHSVDQLSTTNIETWNFLSGGASNDLIIARGNSTQLHGGAGTDTLYADWSNAAVGIVWNSDATLIQNLANGVTASGFERLVMTAGSGTDDIDIRGMINSDITTGTGSDTITASTGGVKIDGGADIDTINISTISTSSYYGYTNWYVTNAANVALFNLNYNSTRADISNALANGATFSLQYGISAAWGNQLSITNTENWNFLSGSSSNDLIIVHGNSTQAHGGAGVDALYADWSATTTAINLLNTDPALTKTVNGMAYSGIERLVISTGSGADVVTNTYTGNNTSDYIDAGAGNDTVDGGIGADTIFGGTGDDILSLTAGTVDGGTGLDTLNVTTITTSSYLGYTNWFVANAANAAVANLNYNSARTDIANALTNGVTFYLQYTTTNSVFGNQLSITNTENWNFTNGGASADLIIARGTSTQLHGGAGTDTLYADWSGATANIVWNSDASVLQSLANGVTASGFERLVMSTGSGTDSIDVRGMVNSDVNTGTGNDTIFVTAGAVKTDGGDGSDTLTVTSINTSSFLGYTNWYVANAANAAVANLNYNSARVDIANALINGATFALQYTTTNSNFGNQFSTANTENWNFLSGGTTNDLIIARGNSTQAHGGAGTDALYADWSAATNAITWVNDPTVVQSVNDAAVSGLERLLLSTGAGNDLIDNSYAGNNTADYLDGGAGVDQLFGGAGNDRLIGRDSGEVLTGGSGDHTYTLTTAAGATLTVSDAAGLDRLEIKADGADYSKTLYTVSGSNFVITVRGAALNVLDTVTVTGMASAASQVESLSIIQTGGATFSTDLVAVWNQAQLGGAYVVNYTAAGLSNPLGTAGADIITGTAGDDLLAGLAGDDLINGAAGNDTLDGGAGLDTLAGGAGNDTYLRDASAPDVITENAGEGTDTVLSSGDYALGANVENLTLSTGLSGSGNELDNVLIGNAASNLLSGLAGNDTLGGADGADTLDGGVGNDSIDGGAGDDRMLGGLGDDTFYVDSAADVVVENAGEGTDLVISSVNHTLAGNIENLTLVGAARSGIGNALNNALTGSLGSDSLVGGAGIDTLNGGVGNDTMAGGLGNDAYYVDSPLDVLVENIGEGTDTVVTSTSYSLRTNFENLALTGIGAANVNGNELNNVVAGNNGDNMILGLLGNDKLTGNAGNDTLDGGAGTDTLIGGLGNDKFYVDSLTDVITENLNEGTDLVVSYIDYTLGTNLENLTLSGTALAATGNELNNLLTGNALANTLTGGLGNDTLDGGSGIDTMTGGLGNDTYVIDNIGDVVIENAGEGTDTIQTSMTTSLVGQVNIENLTLTGLLAANATGNDSNNMLTGNDGNNLLLGGIGNDSLVGGAGVDTLDGGVGNDTMVGGLGNDVYYVDSSLDVLVENVGEGTDTVVTSTSYSLRANFENLALTGIGAANVNGNDLDNTVAGNNGDNMILGLAGNDKLTGNGGNDTLDGGAGTDTLIGGLGNDKYYVDSLTDVITENTGEGTDLVVSYIDYTLGINLENLTLSGTALAAAGNELNNLLTGNALANTLNGGLGNDTFSGGAGADIFVFDTALSALGNVDQITDFSTAQGDVIWLDNDIFTVLGTAGAMNAAQFYSGVGLIGSTSIAQGAGIYYNTTTGGLYYDADGFGGSAAVKFATLAGTQTLSSTTFAVIE